MSAMDDDMLCTCSLLVSLLSLLVLKLTLRDIEKWLSLELHPAVVYCKRPVGLGLI